MDTLSLSNNSKILLWLVKIALWKENPKSPVCIVDWRAMMELAEKHGVLAIVLDAIDQFPQYRRPPFDILMNGISLLVFIEKIYDKHRKMIRFLSHFYHHYGIKMMVLKGYGLSMNYPKPNHRPMGDMDIFHFGQWREADACVHDRLGVKIDNSHHHHTVFVYQGVTVENHYDFLNVHSRKSNVEFEKVLKSLAAEDNAIKDDEIENVFYPSPNFNALFIVRHSAGNFCASGIILRQVLDWLLFVKRFHDKVDWDFVYRMYRKFNLVRYVNSLNAIGIQYLGFDAKWFPEYEKDERLVERIIKDMLEPEFKGKENGCLMTGVLVKMRRWWLNRWKIKITASDSLCSVFLYSVYSKLLKPVHFRY